MSTEATGDGQGSAGGAVEANVTVETAEGASAVATPSENEPAEGRPVDDAAPAEAAPADAAPGEELPGDPGEELPGDDAPTAWDTAEPSAWGASDESATDADAEEPEPESAPDAGEPADGDSEATLNAALAAAPKEHGEPDVDGNGPDEEAEIPAGEVAEGATAGDADEDEADGDVEAGADDEADGDAGEYGEEYSVEYSEEYAEEYGGEYSGEGEYDEGYDGQGEYAGDGEYEGEEGEPRRARRWPRVLMALGFVVLGAGIVGGAYVIVGKVTGGFKQPAPEISYTQSKLFSLRTGECFDPDGQSYTLISCNAPHVAEVFATFQLTGAKWPGDTALASDASSGCATRLTDYINPQLALSLTSTYVYPDATAWQGGTKTVICEVRASSGDITGSVRGASATAG
jgi:hypothetical protein